MTQLPGGMVLRKKWYRKPISHFPDLEKVQVPFSLPLHLSISLPPFFDPLSLSSSKEGNRNAHYVLPISEIADDNVIIEASVRDQ
jgi:hypothetical protein